MAKINYKFCEDKVLYDSGDIEGEMLELYKQGKNPEGGHFFYATTPVRENIINWYPFKKDATILEVGGGLGSCTGALCREAKKVVSCEYSKRRAENIYYRHKDCDNLEVIVGNINNVKLEDKFDYIILIGVYEYSKRFFQTEDPFSDFLNLLKSFLKPEGVILIAIENRYGIKYWAGSTEDHYGIKYLGLKNYDNHDIQTLGKRELIDIIEKAGFHYKFYYPYPDYKMPYVVHTDERLPLKSELSSLEIYNHGEQTYNFDYREVLGGLIDNDQYGFFANSFLVEISNKKSSLSNITFVKAFWSRSEKYQTMTTIDSHNNIKKIPKNVEVIPHLDLMCETHKNLANLGVNLSAIKKVGKNYLVEFIDGISLTEHIYNLAEEGKKDIVLKEIRAFYKILRSLASTGKVKKTISKKASNYFSNKSVDILKIGLIDLHMGNIIKKGNKRYIIDQEWVVDYDIPLNYNLYFGIILLFDYIPKLELLFDKQALLKEYGITKKEIKIYHDMALYFSREVFKNIDIETHKHFLSVSSIYTMDSKIGDLTLEATTSRQHLAASQSELTTVKSELTTVKSELTAKESELEMFRNRKVIKIMAKVSAFKKALLNR